MCIYLISNNGTQIMIVGNFYFREIILPSEILTLLPITHTNMHIPSLTLSSTPQCASADHRHARR